MGRTGRVYRRIRANVTDKPTFFTWVREGQARRVGPPLFEEPGRLAQSTRCHRHSHASPRSLSRAIGRSGMETRHISMSDHAAGEPPDMLLGADYIASALAREGRACPLPRRKGQDRLCPRGVSDGIRGQDGPPSHRRAALNARRLCRSAGKSRVCSNSRRRRSKDGRREPHDEKPQPEPGHEGGRGVGDVGARRWYLLTPSWTSAVKTNVHDMIPAKNPTATLAPKSATMLAPIATHHPSWYGLVRPMERPSRKGDRPAAEDDHGWTSEGGSRRHAAQPS